MQVQGYKERWVKAHEISKEWVARMTTLVECWNKLDGNVGELSSWVNTKVSKVQTVVNHTQCQNVAISAINLLAPDRQRLVSVSLTNLNSEDEMQIPQVD